MMDWTKTCDAVGPDTQVGPRFIRHAKCNRVLGHEGPHQERKRESFQLMAEWDEKKRAPRRRAGDGSAPRRP